MGVWYLFLLDGFDGHLVSRGFLHRNVRVAELAMPKQLPERVLGFKIPLVPEVGSFSQGHRLLVVFDVAATHPGCLLPLRNRGHRSSTGGLGVYRGFTMFARFLLLFIPMMRISPIGSLARTRIATTLPAAHRVLAGIVVATVG